MFTSSFQPARHPVRLRPALGAAVSEPVRAAMLDKIQTGEIRMAAVRKWIASRIDLDPMLQRTFGQPHIVENFWGYGELVEKDQYYVDQAVQILNDDLSGWDISEAISSRVDEWAAVVDIMYAGMQEYGKTPLTTAGGVPIPNTTAPPTGGTVPATTGGGSVPAGANLNIQPPSEGLSTQQIVIYGAAGVAVIAVIAIIKKYF